MIPALRPGQTFVGRRDELDFLQEAFERASEGRPSFVPVEGDAGIGKSRLIDEFTTALADGATVARGWCSEQVRSPYLPFLAVLSAVDQRAAARAFDPHRDRGDVEDKAAFLAASAAILQRAAQKKPVVAVVEDVQWADSGTLELLSYLMHGLGDARVLVLVSLRTEDAATNAGLAAFRLQAARSRVPTVRLRGLSRNEIRCLVTARLAHRLPNAGVVGQIERLSEGNPLFAEELSNIAEDGRLNLAADSPVSVDAVLSQRFAPLSERDRSLLVRAAIVGREFDAGFVANIAGVTLDTALQSLQRAVEAQVVVTDSVNPNGFRFRHALIRQALADRLVVGLAAPLHARIAEALEASDPSNVAALAYHWSKARVGDKARAYNERAGESALNVYAYRDAIGFYASALQWEYPAGAERAAAFERLGTLLYIEGCGDEPASWFDRGRLEWEAAGDHVAAARALLRTADQHWVDARTDESMAAARTAVERLAPMQRPAEALEAHLSLARFAITLGDAATAHLELQAAHGLGGSLQIPANASFYEIRAEAGAALGSSAAALLDCATASRLAQAGRNSEAIVQIENNCALVAAELGAIPAAIRRHEIALAEARRTSMPWRIAYSALNFAQTLTLSGDLRRARTIAWEAIESGVTTATFRTKAAAVGIPLALLLNDRRLLDACAREEALELARRSGEVQRISAVGAAFAELRSAQGAIDEARRIVRDTIAAIETIGTPHRCVALVLHVIANGGQVERAWAGAALQGNWARPAVLRACRLLLHAAAEPGGSPRAARSAASAAAQFGRLGWSLARARALEMAGNAGSAYAAYTAMGDVRDADRLAPVACDEGKSRTDSLSPRQRQIAELVAEGVTNRVIAQRLNISEHTVEHHLSSIFARLGLRSRAALAARVGSLPPQ
jgi:DNA-binding CsgD family transcriptional regulator